jgi:transmembrane sensor
MADPKGSLSRHIHYVLTEGEIDEGWQRLDAALRPERSWRRVAVALVAVGVCLALVVFVAVTGRNGRDGMLEPGATLAAGDAELSATLKEGSTIVADARSMGTLEVATSEEVVVRVGTGVMHFDVAKNPKRRFRVLVGRVEVRVIGTAFTVQYRGSTAAVTVQRGVVEIWSEGAQRAVLNAGQTWNEVTTAQNDGAVDSRFADPFDRATSNPGASASLERESFTKRKSTKRHSTKRGTDVADDSEATASQHSGSTAASNAPDSLTTTKPPQEDASTMFREAIDARRSGDASLAATLLTRFLAKYPGDAREGLALFELGRLQMDRLDQPTNAIETLERAVLRAPTASYAEDAMARLVRLHHLLHQRAACKEARAAYLERFPSGVHTATLLDLCER